MSWIWFCTSLVKRLVVDVSLHSWTTFGLLTMLIKTDSENVKIKLLVKWQKAYFIVMMIGTCPLWYTSVTEISFQVMYSLVLNYKNVISLMFVTCTFFVLHIDICLLEETLQLSLFWLEGKNDLGSFKLVKKEILTCYMYKKKKKLSIKMTHKMN